MAFEPAPSSSTPAMATFTYYEQRPTAADVQLVHRAPGERLFRAARALAGCWGLGVVSVFIPLAHFFLVPGFLLLGPVLAVQRLGEAVTVVKARGACPACGQPLDVTLKDRWKPAIPVRCAACRRRIELVVPLDRGAGPAGTR